MVHTHTALNLALSLRDDKGELAPRPFRLLLASFCQTSLVVFEGDKLVHRPVCMSRHHGDRDVLYR